MRSNPPHGAPPPLSATPFSSALALVLHQIIMSFAIPAEWRAFQVIDKLSGARFSAARWRQLGQRLLPPTADLEAIEVNCRNVVEDCLERVVDQFLREGEDVTWVALAKAVAICRGGGRNIAITLLQSVGIDPEGVDLPRAQEDEEISDASSSEDDEPRYIHQSIVPDDSSTFTRTNTVEICREIQGAEKKVFALGLELKLTPNTRKKLNTQELSAEDRLLKTLEEYKKLIQPEPSWKGVAEALGSEIVGLNNLAEVVRDVHCPGWRAEEDYNDLKTQFGDLINAICDAIERRDIGVKRVVDTIRGLPIFREERDKVYFRTFTDDFRQSKNVPSLFDRLICHWDYLHPEIYSPLIKKLSPDNNLLSQSSNYLKKKQDFVDKTPLAAFCKIPDIETEKDTHPPPGFVKFITQLKREPPPMYLKEVEKFRRRLARKCNLQSCLVTVAALKLSCVVITMWLPSQTELYIARDRNFIEEHSITRMVFNGMVIYSQEKSEIGSSVDTVRKNVKYPSRLQMAVKLIRKELIDRPVYNVQRLWKSLLTKAAESGNVEEVRRLIASGEDLNPNTVSTPLKEACEKGDLVIIRVLLEAGANPNNLSDDWTPLMEAAKMGHKEAIKLLVENGADPNTINSEKWTALMAASNNGRTEAVDQLLQLHADPNMQDHVGWSALLASVFKQHQNIALRLTEAGANPHLQNMEYRSALRLAIEYKQYTVFDAFLDIRHPDVKAGLRGHPDLDSTDKYGETDLLYACKENDFRIVIKLLRKGADPNLANNNSDFPLIVAAEHENVEMVIELLRAGATPDLATKEGNTSLTEAAKTSSREMVTELLHAGAPPNHFSNQGTALAKAAMNGKIRIMEDLLMANADPNIAEFVDQLPLYHARQKNNKEMIQLLTDHNADASLLMKLPRRATQFLGPLTKLMYS